MEKLLAERTAFVSGSGQNIGRAVALRLAELGCNVVINGATNESACRETAKLVEGAGGKSLIVMGDVALPETISKISKAALDVFGTVDIVVNNAARRPHKPFLEMSDEDWYGVVDTAMTAAFRTSRAFLPGMVDQRWGRIINFAGMKAMRGYFEGAPISAAKHGVWGLTKALSTEFAPKGITVNIVSPGQIRKDSLSADDPKRAAMIPVGHMGTSNDIASVVAFLASPDARFVTGQMIAANGGEET